MALTGRFGPFVQLGEMEDDSSKEKPKRASVLESQDVNTIGLDDALALLSLPRVVGNDPEGNEITVQNGRYGPYLKKGTDSRSLEREEQLFTVTVAEAEALFAQPKQRGRRTKAPIAELGPHPESGVAVRVLDGRFGPYVTDGTINATVPRGVDPAEIDLGQAVELLREREARGPAQKRPRKKAAPKTTKRVVKKGTSKTSRAGKAKKAKKAAAKVSAAGADDGGAVEPEEPPSPEEEETAPPSSTNGEGDPLA